MQGCEKNLSLSSLLLISFQLSLITLNDLVFDLNLGVKLVWTRNIQTMVLGVFSIGGRKGIIIVVEVLIFNNSLGLSSSLQVCYQTFTFQTSLQYTTFTPH